MKSQPKTSAKVHERGSDSQAYRRSGARGVALVTTLILLALLGAASVAMVLLVSSDMMINGYYRNYRGSFYAADSGVNAVVETLKNSIGTNATKTASPPLPANGAVPAAVTASYTPYQKSEYTFGDTNSWHAQFELMPNPSGAPVLGAATVTSGKNTYDENSPGNGDLEWTFIYPFTVTVRGQSSGTEGEEITETGTIKYVSAPGSPTSGAPPRFSKWGAFIDKFAPCQGPLVPGTMTGPFFTDGQWNFGSFSNPGYTFVNTIGQVGTDASWIANNKCTNSPTAPSGFKQPKFESGFQEAQAAVVPPTDTYNQAQAVLDGKGTPPCTATPCGADPAPSQTQMSAELKTAGGGAYSASATGVYIPYYSNGQVPTYGSDPNNGGDGAGGGFYVNGDASITLSATTAGTGATQHPTQTYTITQGSTTTTIVVDNVIVVNNVKGETTVTSGSTKLVLQGVPEQLDPNTGAAITQTDPSGSVVNPTMIYVNGNVAGLSGTVQNDTGINITASTSVSITGDLTYATAPVTIPSDALNSSTNAGVLGIYTNGNINLYANASGSNSGNLTVDASLAAIGSGTSGFETPGKNGINTWTIVGGRSEDQAHSVSISSGNTYYDQRFAGNFGPPWFPTAVPQAGAGAVNSFESITLKRTSWQEVGR